MKNILMVIIFITASFVLPFTGKTESVKFKQEDVTEISVTQLHQMMEEKDFMLINVHIPYAGEIPQTDLFIPYNEISGHINELPAKDKKIVLYCRSDRMSTIAAETLAKAGYSNIYNLKGGMKAWKAVGYKLIEKQPLN